MLRKSSYPKASRPNAKYRTKVISRPLKNTGRKTLDMAGWKVK